MKEFFINAGNTVKLLFSWLLAALIVGSVVSNFYLYATIKMDREIMGGLIEHVRYKDSIHISLLDKMSDKHGYRSNK